MNIHWTAVLVTIGFSMVGTVGDYFLKLASEAEVPVKSPSFLIGFAVYASTAFGWVFVMKHLKLATVAVVYSVSMVILLTLIGWLWFDEALNLQQIIGIALAIASLYLLT